jgi:hypothetical protein
MKSAPIRVMVEPTLVSRSAVGVEPSSLTSKAPFWTEGLLVPNCEEIPDVWPESATVGSTRWEHLRTNRVALGVTG